MGKPGGFFKRLKSKQKRSESRRRRGTKGASREERRLKHNELVDYHAAKREAEELAAISSSSSEDDLTSTDSEKEILNKEKSLLALRQVLGVAEGGRSAKRTRDDTSVGTPNSQNGMASRKFDDSEHHRAGDASPLGSEAGEDWTAFLPPDEEEEELEELEEDDDSGSEAELDGADEGFDEESEGADEYDSLVSEEDELEESEDSGKEDAYEDDDNLDQKQLEEERTQLLPQFRPGTTSHHALKSVVHENDPWMKKYHIDSYGEVDATSMRPLKPKVKLTCDNVMISASEHAVRNFLHFPFSAGLRSTTTASQCEAERPAYMHETLWKKWLDYCKAESRGSLTAEERGLLNLLQGYPDVMDCCRSWENADARREVFILHALNHWYKTRSVVLLHDTLLREAKQQKARGKKSVKRKKVEKGKNTDSAKAESCSSDDSDGDENYELRDRGFGKTRVLVMLPMRNIAYRYVTTMIKILRAKPDDCPRFSTFNDDFTELAEAQDPTFSRRPRDYQRQFAGNIDDSFCIGLRVEPSRVRVYAHPLSSDIIICSPLGLRRRLERNGDALVSLSSIEVCLIDEAHVLFMQNWQHVASVLQLLNKRPRDTTYGLSDLRRVYAWALAGHSGRHRQTIMSSNLTNATLLATFRTFINNSGRVLLQRREERGTLQQVMIPVRQHFLRFDPGNSAESCDDSRFDFFTQKVFPKKISPLISRDVRTIIFVPSYFDYVRLRNYMAREHRDSFAAICEYTSLRQQRKSLGQFTDLERPLLLVTERFYFFRRYFVKHAETIIFYSPPVFPEFYVSLVSRLVATSPNAFSLVLFCRYDSHELNRLVGTSRAKQLLEREAEAYSFVTN